MKLRKLFAAITSCAVALTAMATLSFSASAAEVDLPLAPTAMNNDTQKGWATNGTDGNETDLTIEQLASATTLVLEFGAAPTGGMQVIFQCDGDDWAWNQNNGIIPDSGTTETKIEIDLTSLTGWTAVTGSTQAKFFLGYYSNGFDDLKITRAYLVTGDAPAAATPAPAAEEAPAEPAAEAAAPADSGATIGDGVVYSSTADGSSGTLFSIAAGTDAAAWPFSTDLTEAGEATGAAFTATPDATYRLTFDITSAGTTGFRVRYFRDHGYNSTVADDDLHSAPENTFTADQTATSVPAYFPDSIAAGETKTYTVEFTMDGSAEAGGNIGNIGIRGQYGSNDYVINSVTLEEVGGAVLVDWVNPNAGGAVIEDISDELIVDDTPVVDAPVESTEAPAPKTGNTPIAVAVSVMVIAGAAVVATRKRK